MSNKYKIVFLVLFTLICYTYISNYKNTKRGRKWEKSDPGYESELLLKLTQRAHKKK